MAARNARRDSAGNLSPFGQRLRRYEAVLRPLLLWEAFAAMPRRAQELFAQYKFPDPLIEFDASFPTDPQHRALRKTLEKRFAEARVAIEDAVPVTVRDFFSVVAGLKYTVRDSRNQASLPPACHAFMSLAGPLLDRWYEGHFEDVWASLHRAVIGPLVAHSRLDTRMVAASLRQESTPNGKYVMRTTVAAEGPQARTVSLDGTPRPMVRVGTSNEWDGVRWLAWEQKPVFAQSHALRQLRERVNLHGMAEYLECWLHNSLRDANVVERQGNDLLVKFRIREQRLGYLIVTPLDDVVAVRTFKFLTMENTPEARMLAKKLRLSRRDVDWLGLSDLAAFTQTDLRDDAELRAMLGDCGCGHLFELAETRGGEDFAPAAKPFAAEMRKYLRMAA